MNIWIMNHYAIAPSENGGTRHFNLASKLVEMGHTVRMFAADYNHFSLQSSDYANHPEKQNLDIEGIKYTYVPVMPYQGNGAKRFYGMFQYYRNVLNKGLTKNFEKPDIVLGSSPHPFAALAAYKLAKRYKAKFVYEVRDFWPSSLVELNKLKANHPIAKIFGRIEATCMKHADAVISILPYGFEYVQTVSSSPVYHIPNFVNLGRIQTKSIENDGRPFTFIFAGNHGVANSLDTILEAAKILAAKVGEDAFRVQLIGGGPEKEALMHKKEQENIETVEFLGPFPKAQIYQYLAAADAFIITLKQFDTLVKWGASPNKLYDYMSMAKPVIYAVDERDNIVEDNDAGIKTPAEDVAALANAMETLINMPAEKRQQMGSNGRQLVEREYSLEAVSRKLNTLFNDIMEK